MTPMNNKKAGIKFFASGNKVVALGFCIKQYHAIFVVSSTELQQIYVFRCILFFNKAFIFLLLVVLSD